jgi:sulfite exporter TauE/SafE
MNLVKRVQGLLIRPKTEWSLIETENTSIRDLFLFYICPLAALPPFASFLSAYLFGVSHGPSGLVHPTLTGGLARAALQYVLSLPALYLIAFVISTVAPYFDGRTNDRKALALTAYAYTPAWLASLFGLIPGLRWLDILGFYGLYLLYLGLPKMTRCPKDHADVFTLVVVVLSLAAGALHARIVHWIIPWQSISL